MKCAGIIGGIAAESTIDYYRKILAGYRGRVTDGSSASIIINSVDLQKILDLIVAARYEALVDYLCGEIAKLARAGADFAVLSSNTPHIAFDAIREKSPIPLISIVEATARAAAERRFKRVGLFGTRFTMRGGFYKDVFANAGITVVMPDDAEQNYIHSKYLGDVVNHRYTGEFVNGIFLPETRQGLIEIISHMIEREKIEALILGGTELPLILRDEREAGIPLLDTTSIHVDSIVAEIFS
jgi:aspartate racemase